MTDSPMKRVMLINGMLVSVTVSLTFKRTIQKSEDSARKRAGNEETRHI